MTAPLRIVTVPGSRVAHVPKVWATGSWGPTRCGRHGTILVIRHVQHGPPPRYCRRCLPAGYTLAEAT